MRSDDAVIGRCALYGAALAGRAADGLSARGLSRVKRSMMPIGEYYGVNR
jgi:hypothetical protein